MQRFEPAGREEGKLHASQEARIPKQGYSSCIYYQPYWAVLHAFIAGGLHIWTAEFSLWLLRVGGWGYQQAVDRFEP